jgi:hypothetical protein
VGAVTAAIVTELAATNAIKDFLICFTSLSINQPFNVILAVTVPLRGQNAPVTAVKSGHRTWQQFCLYA